MEPKHLLKLDFQPVSPRGSRARLAPEVEGPRLPVFCRAPGALALVRACGGAG